MVTKQVSTDTRHCNNHFYLIRPLWIKAGLQQQQKSHRKSTYLWKVNNSLLSNLWVKNKESKDFLEIIENEGITYTDLWETLKGVLRGKFI